MIRVLPHAMHRCSSETVNLQKHMPSRDTTGHRTRFPPLIILKFHIVFCTGAGAGCRRPSRRRRCR